MPAGMRLIYSRALGIIKNQIITMPAISIRAIAHICVHPWSAQQPLHNLC